MNSNQYERSLNNGLGTAAALGSATSALSSSALSSSALSSSALSSAASSIASASANTSTGILSTITSLSWTTWLIVVLVLAFLGINVFSVLAKGSETVAEASGTLAKGTGSLAKSSESLIQSIALLFKPILDVFSKIFKFLGLSTLETVKQTANISATGVSAAANTTAGAVSTAADTIESSASGTSTISDSASALAKGVTPIDATSSAKTGTNIQSQMQQGGSQIDYGSQRQQGQMTDVRNDTLQRALNDAESHMNEQNQQNEQGGIQPVDAYGSSSTAGKAGYCFIGEEQGIRSCAPVGANDQCMSGDVFPTNDVCMNPKLRVG